MWSQSLLSSSSAHQQIDWIMGLINLSFDSMKQLLFIFLKLMLDPLDVVSEAKGFTKFIVWTLKTDLQHEFLKLQT